MEFDDMINGLLDKAVRASLDDAKMWLQGNPESDVPPFLEVYALSEDSVECHHYNFAMAVDSRFNIAKSMGEKHGRDNDQVAITITAMSAWKAEYSEDEAKRSNRIPAREHPERQEIIMVAGQSITHQYLCLTATVDRSNDQVTFGETEEITNGETRLLDIFWYRYSAIMLSSLSSGTQLLN